MKTAIAIVGFTCATGCYRPELVGDHPVVGCVEVAVAPATDPSTTGPIVDYRFYNRCGHDAVIDLASVVVVARDQAGATSPLVAYDPGGEIRALRIAAHRSGQERIEYHAPGDDEAPRVAPIAEELAALRRQRDALAATAERSPAGSPDVRPAVEALDQAIAALEARLPVRPPTSASASPARLCADVGRIDGSSTAPRWTCLVPPRVD